MTTFLITEVLAFTSAGVDFLYRYYTLHMLYHDKYILVCLNSGYDVCLYINKRVYLYFLLFVFFVF